MANCLHADRAGLCNGEVAFATLCEYCADGRINLPSSPSHMHETRNFVCLVHRGYHMQMYHQGV